MEESNQPKPADTAGRKLRIAYFGALASLSWFFANEVFFTHAFGIIIAPFDELLALSPFAAAIGVGGLIILPLAWFLISYYVARFCLFASGQFQFSLVALLLVALGLCFALHETRSPIDWRPHGLNPDYTGLKPRVVILSGTTDKGYFEIRMRGADYYYRKTWNQVEWTPGAWFDLELDIPDFYMDWGSRCTGLGSGGGGGSTLGRPEDLVLARRLWNGTNFIGAKTNEFAAEEREFGIREEFDGLEKIGSWLIPKKIRFSERNLGEETYTIKKVEFWNLPSTNWYLQIKDRYFGPGRFMRKNDLHEPGPILWKKN